LASELERARAAAWSGVVPGTGPQGHERLFFTLSRLLREPEHAEGVLLFVDDAGAADEATLDVLRYLARSGPRERILVVAACQPEEPGTVLARFTQELLAESAVRELSLGPLGDEPAAALVERRAGGRLAPVTVRRIVELAGGSPLALEELTAALSTSGELRIPARLDAALASRLELLGPDLRSVLPRVAIAGTVLRRSTSSSPSAEWARSGRSSSWTTP
jgi:predicted ATPase